MLSKAIAFRKMNRGIIVLCVLLAGAAPMARADYAVLRSGVRLHITGYETAGDRVRLTVEGGTVEVAAGEILSIEPEDVFPSRPTVAPLPDGPYAKLIRASAEKHGVDENLIHRMILVESNFNPKAVSRTKRAGTHAAAAADGRAIFGEKRVRSCAEY